MSHYDVTQWVDFVRGLANAGEAAPMQQHLDQGCESCAAAVRRLSALATMARTDDLNEPPAHLLRFAKAAFSLQQPSRLLSLPRLVARLAFNSLETAVAQGTRGPVEELSRQSLYEAGDFSVHLRFEQPSGASRVSLIGQIANRRVPEPPMAHVPVLLTRGRSVVARSLSNEFGEFQIEYDPHPALRLHIPVSDGRQSIRMALDGLSGDVSDEDEMPARARTHSVRPAAGRRGRVRQH